MKAEKPKRKHYMLYCENCKKLEKKLAESEAKIKTLEEQGKVWIDTIFLQNENEKLIRKRIQKLAEKDKEIIRLKEEKDYFISQNRLNSLEVIRLKKDVAEKDAIIKVLTDDLNQQIGYTKDAYQLGRKDCSEKIKQLEKEIADMQKEINDLNKSHDFFIENWKTKVKEKDKEIFDLKLELQGLKLDYERLKEENDGMALDIKNFEIHGDLEVEHFKLQLREKIKGLMEYRKGLMEYSNDRLIHKRRVLELLDDKPKKVSA